MTRIIDLEPKERWKAEICLSYMPQRLALKQCQNKVVAKIWADLHLRYKKHGEKMFISEKQFKMAVNGCKLLHSLEFEGGEVADEFDIAQFRLNAPEYKRVIK